MRRQRIGVETTLCAPKGQIASGGRIHSNSRWLDSIAIGQPVRETGLDETSRQSPRKGGRATWRAVTRVKLEQSSKAAMWMPARRFSGEGRADREEPGAGARHRHNDHAPIRTTGVVSTACEEGSLRQWGRPGTVWESRTSNVVDRMADRLGVGKGRMYRRSRVTPVEGRSVTSAPAPAPALDSTRTPDLVEFELSQVYGPGEDRRVLSALLPARASFHCRLSRRPQPSPETAAAGKLRE